MLTPADLLEPSLLKRMSGLEIIARSVVEGTVSGLHRSPFKGSSVEFTQHRPYVPGDELRRLDWKVKARTDRSYIKEYEEETNVKCRLLLDASGSMAYTSGGMTKHEYAARIAGAIAYLMLSQTDSVGLTVFDSAAREYVAPRSKRGQLRNIIRILASVSPGGQSNLAKVLDEAADAAARRGLFIVFSDFFAEADDVLRGMAHLRYGRHEVIAFQVLDRAEIEFPFRRWTKFEDMEEPGRFRLVDPAVMSGLYRSRFQAHRERLRSGCIARGIDFVTFVTDEPLGERLTEYLALRMRRVRMSRGVRSGLRG